MISTVISSPKDFARHAREYELLKRWFSRRISELGLNKMDSGDMLDPHHPYNQGFEALCKEAESLWVNERGYKLSPMQLSHAFFQMKDPILAETMKA